MKSSAYYFHLTTKILADFQICISVPLKHLNSDKIQRVFALWFFRSKNFLKTSAESFRERMSCIKTFF